MKRKLSFNEVHFPTVFLKKENEINQKRNNTNDRENIKQI